MTETIKPQFDVNSKYGRGTFFITDSGVRFESQKYSTVFSVPFSQIRGVQVIRPVIGKKKFRIDWEIDKRKYFFVFYDIPNPQQIHDEYLKANREWASIQPERKEEKKEELLYEPPPADDMAHELDEVVHNIAMEEYQLGHWQKQGITEDTVAGWKTKIEERLKSDEEAVQKRRQWVDTKIPKGYMRWNDTWYDPETDLYITYNPVFIEDPYWRELKTYNKWKSKYDKDCMIVGTKNLDQIQRVFFFNGYPAVKLYKNDDKYLIIPTITKEMLTPLLVSYRQGYVSGRPIVDYNFEYPRYYIAPSDFTKWDNRDDSVIERAIDNKISGSRQNDYVNDVVDRRALFEYMEDYDKAVRQYGISSITVLRYADIKKLLQKPLAH